MFDTNVLLAAFGSRGLCEALYALCIEQHAIIVSEHILAEFHEHLVSKFGATVHLARQAAESIRDNAELAAPAPLPEETFPDRDDIPVLGTAISGNADCLVTGDAALLALKEFRGIAVLSPRELFQRLRSAE